jgi:tetratricopeptide (TPR) repeat protein
MRAPPLTVVLLAVAVPLLSGQKAGEGAAPRRPKLPRGADTSSGYDYYRLGLSRLRVNPKEAAAAFYWAERLSPLTAVAYYGERIALLMADPYTLRGYIEGDRRVLASARVRRIDSLQVRAVTLDPFFPRNLDEDLIVTYFTNLVRDRLRQQGAQVSDGAIEYVVRTAIDDADPSMRARLAYARGNYGQAVAYWAGQERNDPKDANLRALRSHALFLMGAIDSARAELEAALATAQRADAEELKYVYDSKVLWRFQLGRMYELQGSDSAARDAYQRALVEDLSFYPAHVRLAYVALHASDTTTAVRELESAIQVKGDDFSARLLLGIVQAARHAFDSATEHLNHAADIEPWVAYPHFVLGGVRLEAGDRDGAVTEYRRFLALAAQNDPDVATARQRLAELGAAAR